MTQDNEQRDTSPDAIEQVFQALVNLQGSLVLASNYKPDETIAQFVARCPHLDEASIVLHSLQDHPLATGITPNQPQERVTPASEGALREALQDVFDYFSDRNQAPGHCHTTPGIWDDNSSNGERAGKPCDWCAKWERARSLLSHPPAIDIAQAPKAWLHTLHMEGGQTYERLLDWDGVDADEPQRTAFGLPGRDYSAEYSVTSQPLYSLPAAPSQDTDHVG